MNVTANSNEPNPYANPQTVANDDTVAECALGIPPSPKILVISNFLVTIAFIITLPTCASSQDNNVIPRILFDINSVKYCTDISPYVLLFAIKLNYNKNIRICQRIREKTSVKLL